jgi:hypothetical protein
VARSSCEQAANEAGEKKGAAMGMELDEILSRVGRGTLKKQHQPLIDDLLVRIAEGA